MLFISLLMITTLGVNSALRVSQGTKSSPISEDRIDLKPPQYESISQYNQPQTLAQVLGIHSQHQLLHPQLQQQQTQLSPFLYLGPLIFSTNPTGLIQKPPTRQQKNTERADTQSQEENSYDSQDSYSIIYRPSLEEDHVELSPPSLQQEPNYYALKPRKFKKYQGEEESDKKISATKSIDDLKKRIKIAEIESYDDDLESPKNLNPENIERDLTENIRAARDLEDLLTAASEDDFVKENAPTSRLDFQMHGHRGPSSYKFGYDTGENSNLNRKTRQFHVEERNSEGDVLGSYGHYDRRGKFRVVNYASGKDGFRIL